MSESIRQAAKAYLEDKSKNGYASEDLVASWTKKLAGLNCERVVLSTLSKEMESATRLPLGEMLGRVMMARGTSEFKDERYPEGSRWWVEIERVWPKAAKSLGISGYVSGRIDLSSGIQYLILDRFKCHGRDVSETYIKLDYLLSVADLMPTTVSQADVEYPRDYMAKPEVREWLERQVNSGASAVDILAKIGEALDRKLKTEGSQNEKVA